MTQETNPYATPQAEVVESNRPYSGEPELASRWARLGGAILDAIIIMAITLPVIWLLVLSKVDLATWQPSLTYLITSTVGGFLAWLLIQGYFLHSRSQTIGKMAAGIVMVDMETGQRAGFGQLVFKRYLPMQLVAAIPMIGGVLAIINVLLIFRSDKRCGHDLIAGTGVVKLKA